MKSVVRFVAVLALVVGAQSQANATDYCPEGYYGFINGYYSYYCDYCDATGACQSTGVSVASMYSCGGDFDCCSPGATCIDPIPGSAVKVTEPGAPKPVPEKSAGGAKKATLTAHAAKADQPPHIPMLIGEVAQSKYLSAKEKFIIPGDHVTKDLDTVVKVREPNGGDSYFRLFQITYRGKDRKKQGTIFFGMEMDPKTATMTANMGLRKKKGQGKVYKHTVTFNNEEYDVSSVRVLPDAS